MPEGIDLLGELSFINGHDFALHRLADECELKGHVLPSGIRLVLAEELSRPDQ